VAAALKGVRGEGAVVARFIGAAEALGIRAQGAEQRRARPGRTRVRLQLWHEEGDGPDGRGLPGDEGERGGRGAPDWAKRKGIGPAVWAKGERKERKEGREGLGRKTGQQRRKTKKRREGRSWAGLKAVKGKRKAL